MVKAGVAVEEGKEEHQIKPMTLIENKRAIKVRFKKRKNCIMKKTMELSTLCGTKACTVCFGPNGEVETWPENQSEFRTVIDAYKVYGKKGKEVDNQSSGEGISAEKIKFKNFLMGIDDGWLNGIPVESLKSLLGQFDSKLETLKSRIGFLNRANEENRAPYWFGMSALMENFEMVGSGSVIYGMSAPMENFEMVGSDFVIYPQPLQTLGPDNLSNSFHTLQNTVSFDAPLNSIPPVWPLNSYTGSMTTFDAPMSNYYGDPMGSNGGGSGGGNWSFPSTYDGRLGETNLNSANNYSNQVLAGSGNYSLSSPLDDIVLGSMFVDDSFTF